MADYIKNNTQEENANILAQYLRNDDLHASKNIEGSNLRKLLLGLAEGFKDVNNNINILVKNGNVNEATELIELWEKTVGIPDDCLDNSGTIEERRNKVLIKFAGLQGTLIEQFEYVINLLGYSGIEILPAYNYLQIPTPIPTPLVSIDAIPFTIFVKLPDELTPTQIPAPIPTPLDNPIPLIDCIFNKLKPANIKILYLYNITFTETRSFITLENGDFLVAENGDFFVTEP